MKRFLRSKLIFPLVTVVMLAGAIAIPLSGHITRSRAANGDLIHETHFSTPCPSGIGVGIAFDGVNLWYSCYSSNPDLYEAQPLTGAVIAKYNVAGGLGALAWDGRHNKLWAAWGGGAGSVGDIRLIDTTNGSSTVVFNATAAGFINLDDGLAYDALDDSLLISPDTSTTIYHYSSTGNLLDSFPWAGHGCYNSGVAIGGSLLFEGSDGCDHIWVVNRSDNSPAFDFPTGADGVRDEGMACDNISFAPKNVMWSMEAYEPRRAIAFEIPSGSCGFGGQPAPLIDFKQNRNADGSLVPWAKDHLFDIPNCPTMETDGCAITSLADILASYGLKTLPDGTSVDPGHLNHYLGQNPGTHSGCEIWFNNIPQVVNYNLLHNDFAETTSLDQRIQDINDALKAGHLVIAGISGDSHFVVFYQKSTTPAPDGSPDYFIADPYRYQPYASGDRSGMTLCQAYHETINQLKDSLQVVVFENKAPQPGRSWVLVAHSPVQLLITDPTGAQSGFNPATGSYLLNIPGSSYGVQKGLSDDSGVQPPLPDSLYFGQNALENGTYKIQVIGTGSGPYTLDFGVASGPGNTSLQTVTGTAVPGQTDTYIVSTSGGQPISIKRQVQIDIKPGEDPPAINPTSNGKTPVALLSTPTFDATTVDPNSVKFGPNGASPVHTSIEDVNGDGIPDLMFQFNTAQTGIAAGDTQACLTGKTTSGLNIVGCDTIQTVPPGS